MGHIATVPCPHSLASHPQPRSWSEKFPEGEGWHWACWPGADAAMQAAASPSLLPTAKHSGLSFSCQVTHRKQGQLLVTARSTLCTCPDTGAVQGGGGTGEAGDGGTKQLSTGSAGPPVPGWPALQPASLGIPSPFSSHKQDPSMGTKGPVGRWTRRNLVRGTLLSLNPKTV